MARENDDDGGSYKEPTVQEKIRTSLNQIALEEFNRSLSTEEIGSHH
jgi:hypothetical protein